MSFDHSLLTSIGGWTRQNILQLCFAVDMGGSGIRIRLSNAIAPSETLDLPHMKAGTTAEVHQVMNELADAIEIVAPSFRAKGAALAVAGPIANGQVVLTNWSGDPRLRTIKISELPKKLCPIGRTTLLNDLEAGAYGVLAVGEIGGLGPLFQQLWTDVAPAGPVLSQSRTAVLAMGSGYGAALIVKNSLLKDPFVVPTELGHQQIPLTVAKDPNAAEELELIQFVSDFYYKGVQTPEFEDIASGRGLRLAYQFFYQKDKGELLDFNSLDAGKIAQQARNDDPIAIQALTWHYKLFIRSAKSIATSLCADSIVLALDNQVKNGWFVLKMANKLKEEFYNFIRPDWLKHVRVYTQTQLLNFNILGTDYIAHRLASQ